MIEEDKIYRELYFTDCFRLFYSELQDKIKVKFDYVFEIVRTERIVSTKFVKHLVETDLYEMRVSVGNNEYRTILFAIDNENFQLAKRIIVLNGFLKKSTKDYKKQISIAEKLINEFEL